MIITKEIQKITNVLNLLALQGALRESVILIPSSKEYVKL